MSEGRHRSDDTTRQKPLWLWPGMVAVALQWLAWLVVPTIAPGSTTNIIGVATGFIGGLVVVVWWAFFSRAPRADRWGAAALMIVALVATPRILHESVAAGNMGLQFYIYAVPTLSLAFVVWAVASRAFADGPRRAAMVATVLLGCGGWALVRSDGITGYGFPEFAWRWSETAEERLLARVDDEPRVLTSAPASKKKTAQHGDVWPGLRGPDRNGVIRSVPLATDWSASPPVELWRRPIGPGVSSIVVRGDLLYTQEQRGEDEIVAAYTVAAGKPVWRHRETTRFWDSHVGAGPRATPALSDGRVYAFGAAGILNALDAATGDVVWSRNAASDTDATVPLFGFVSSPLVVDDLVVVYTNTLVAYDRDTGEPRWVRPAAGESYNSPRLVTLDGIAQILQLTPAGVTSVAPADGRLLWEHPWPGLGIVQPALTADGDLLISMNAGSAMPLGTRRFSVAHEPGGWTIEERWTSRGLKPSFSDFVVHDGHAFGFDGAILACIDVEDGTRKWKGGRFGQGQLILLPDQDLLLVLSERGELALVEATSEQFTELARFPAIEGKTWNQPALVGDVLLIRNFQEMAAFRLPLAGL